MRDVREIALAPILAIRIVGKYSSEVNRSLAPWVALFFRAIRWLRFRPSLNGTSDDGPAPAHGTESRGKPPCKAPVRADS
jgi:hypothetical protein